MTQESQEPTPPRPEFVVPKPTIPEISRKVTLASVTAVLKRQNDINTHLVGLEWRNKDIPFDVSVITESAKILQALGTWKWWAHHKRKSMKPIGVLMEIVNILGLVLSYGYDQFLTEDKAMDNEAIMDVVVTPLNEGWSTVNTVLSRVDAHEVLLVGHLKNLIRDVCSRNFEEAFFNLGALTAYLGFFPDDLPVWFDAREELYHFRAVKGGGYISTWGAEGHEDREYLADILIIRQKLGMQCGREFINEFLESNYLQIVHGNLLPAPRNTPAELK